MTTEQPPISQAPGYLSASSISTWEQCPQRYKYSRIDGIPEPSNESQILGTFVHEVLEKLYSVPPEQRTIANAQQISRTVWALGWADKLNELNIDEKQMREFRWKAWWCVENLWAVEDPAKVESLGTETEYNVEVAPGISIKGFVDRISKVDDGVKITDYKTGKFPKAAYMDQKWFQLMLYKLIVEKTIDAKVSETELIYLKDGRSMKRTTTDRDDSSILEKVVKVHTEIMDSLKTGSFPTKVSRLCDWCHYKRICPAWSARRG